MAEAEFRMPSLGADMDVGTMLEWFVKPGDAVKRGDIVAVVDTEKAAIEIEVFESGVIEQLVVQVGETVPVGTVLAIISPNGGPGSTPAPVAKKEKKPPPVAEPTPKPVPAAPSVQHAHITPLAQRRAAELNVDLSTLKGSGIGGAVTRADVEQAAGGRTSQAPPPEVPHLRASPAAKKLAAELGVDLATVHGTGAGGAITKANVQQAAAGKKAQKPVTQPPAQPSARLRVSPYARRRASELGVDLRTVQGTGPAGAITKADVEKAEKAAPHVTPSPVPAEAPPQAARPARVPSADKQAAMRRAIAAAMSRSKREIPHYYLGTHIDMSQALSWLEAENLQRSVPERLLYSVLLLKAVARAINEVPEMNGFWADNAFQPSEAIHIGIAISLRQGGLIAPAIHEVDKKTLDEIMRDLKDLVKRARAGVLRSSEISDPTITVTSLGEQGVETVFGVIYPPQVSLVGFGKITQQAWAIEGMLGVRPVIQASLAADHRASDGHRGGRFLAAINRLLQEPEKL